MERGSTIKWIFFAIAALLFVKYGWPLITGSADDKQPTLSAWTAPKPEDRSPETTCPLGGPRFETELSSLGGSLRHVKLLDERYQQDLVTTRFENTSPLRTVITAPGVPDAQQEVAFTDLDWKLGEHDAKHCVFIHEDDGARVTKTIATNGRPFELEVTVKIENLASAPKKHRFTIEQSQWMTQKDMEGHLGRQSEHMTETVAAGTKTERQTPGDFSPKDFEKKEFTPEHWRRAAGDARFAAVSSVYFTKIVMPVEAAAPPVAETQIEERWTDAYSVKARKSDPNYGYMYRARLAYPERELKQGESATYKVLSFTGPKERNLLASIGASDIVDLRSFAVIAKVLIAYLEWIYLHIGNWGWAICILTITVRMLLLPLSFAQIKNSAAMRKLKPEMDALNAKYKDDAAQRGLALQELWRKNGVGNPLMGCLPMLLQIPVWWALYAAIQALVELYHTPFAWFKDLSAPDHLYIIPIVLGASSFLQQKIMPPQGDPQQAKMMMYMMPGIFTVMMLFLPSGLGVYMLTSSLLGIAQQLVVERYLRAKVAGGPATIEVREKRTPSSGDGGKPAAPALGKGKARVRG